MFTSLAAASGAAGLGGGVAPPVSLPMPGIPALTTPALVQQPAVAAAAAAAAAVASSTAVLMGGAVGPGGSHVGLQNSGKESH